MKHPSPDALHLAAEWLESNEGEPDERDPMVEVASWLRALAERREYNQSIRDIAKKLGLPKNLIKQAIKRGELT